MLAKLIKLAKLINLLNNQNNANMNYSLGGDDAVIAYDLNTLKQTIIRKD